MKCPLATVDKYNDFDRGMQAVFSDCLKGDCGWWNQDDNECGIVSAVRRLKLIDDDIAHIRNSLWALEKRTGRT
jgi:hypothetical protein